MFGGTCISKHKRSDLEQHHILLTLELLFRIDQLVLRGLSRSFWLFTRTVPIANRLYDLTV